jgi:hypothetical protein
VGGDQESTTFVNVYYVGKHNHDSVILERSRVCTNDYCSTGSLLSSRRRIIRSVLESTIVLWQVNAYGGLFPRISGVSPVITAPLSMRRAELSIFSARPKEFVASPLVSCMPDVMQEFPEAWFRIILSQLFRHSIEKYRESISSVG